MAEGRITEEGLKHYHKRVGRWYTETPWYEVATKDSILHYSRMTEAYELAYHREKTMLGVIFQWKD